MEKEVKKEVKKQWKVIQPFYDNIQKREVELGEVVEYTKKREELKLIELK